MLNMTSFHKLNCIPDFLDKFFKEHVITEIPIYMSVSPYISNITHSNQSVCALL